MKKSLFVENSQDSKTMQNSYYGSVPSYYSNKNHRESTPIHLKSKMEIFKKSPKSK